MAPISGSSRTLVVLQARVASTRLPAKALLPVAGLPLVVLSALRACNKGLPLVVATSQLETDDALVSELERRGISVFRGSHNDVLARFEAATRALDDSDIVVRLTADNVVPDGEFLSGLITEFEINGGEYLGTDSPADGLPYGLSGEVFRVGALRAANSAAVAEWDREHVTPWIKRNRRAVMYHVADSAPFWSRLRCTVDVFEDYQRVLTLFRDVRDPVHVSWRTLIDRLADLTPRGREPRCPFRIGADGAIISALTLGTAQLGMPYGVANQLGKPSDAQCELLLNTAVESGVRTIDTAGRYGDAEVRIGRLLSPANRVHARVITKIDIETAAHPTSGVSGIREAVDARVYRSSHRLRVERLDTVLLHRWSLRRANAGAIWERLTDLQSEGVIRVLGASVSTPSEACEALAEPLVKHLQIPINPLDWRWRAKDFVSAVARRPDVIIHARSALLQGLLTMPRDLWPASLMKYARGVTEELDDVVRELGRFDRVDLCLAYVRAVPWIASVVVGMETIGQLEMNLRYFEHSELSKSQLEELSLRLTHWPEDLLNPALWKTNDVQ